ncbi:hypothetical protein J132_09871 [Termitomyces sp. J132]|nr:hypothetical protein H2248_000784 [Termitomyces sp. 'cryptogamus']KNZ71417.1 hypothetical protein J132_09871 [Termitomyces sp. J132]
MASPLTNFNYSYSDLDLHYPSSPSDDSNSSIDLSTNPCPAYSAEPYAEPPPYQDAPSSERPRRASTAARLAIAHPYARLYAKKEEVKRRKIWNHALEKSLFTPYEISTIGAPQRRTIYIASLEAHIDKLHAQLLEIGYWPIPMEELKPYHGLNSKTAKSIVSGLQHDASVARLKMLELERANKSLSDSLRLEAPNAYNYPDLLPYSGTAPHLSATTTPQPLTYPVNITEAGKHSIPPQFSS